VDLRQYFRKIRDVEAGLSEPFPIVTSLETADGGKAGTISEVPRSIAAKMIVEGRAVLADDTERDRYRQHQLESKTAAEKADLGQRLHVAFVSERNQNAKPNSKSPVISEK